MATPLANTGGTAASALPAAGGTSESTLSSWAGPYVTNMLGKAQAVANEPYQVYQGPMTAGQSNLQSKVFQGLGSLNFPSNLGQSFASPMGQPQQRGFGPGINNYGGPQVQQPPMGDYGGPGGPAVMPQQGGVLTPYSGGRPTDVMGGDYMGGRRGPAIPFGQAMSQLGIPAGLDDTMTPDIMAANAANQQKNAASRANTAANPASISDLSKRLGLMGGYGGNTSPQGMLTNRLEQPQGMPPTGESSVGSVGYAAPTTGGGTTTLGGMPPGGYDAMGGQGMPPQTLSSYAPPMIHGQQGQMQPQGIAGLQPPQGSQQPSNIAQSYMNPYLQSVLDPQMAELRRQNDITNMQANAKLTGAGAFGGGRQAIMNAENNRNLMQEMNKTVGQGYASAYDKAMGQFNTEQGQSKDLVNMLANAGQAERGIEQEGITADYNEFLAQRDDPMKKTQYLQSMLQGLPYQTVTNSPLGKSGMGQLAEITGSMPSVEKTLRDLGLLPPA